MNNELNKKVRLLVTKLLGNYCMAISAEEAQELISTILDEASYQIRLLPIDSDRNQALEAINKLR